ncbi:hypothetical protein AA313_de0202342 [Arthrobotrys entomopaga]|nr:hypothetical protein AA313_de0202342 [Arthrobotrys entomopaga]
MCFGSKPKYEYPNARPYGSGSTASGAVYDKKAARKAYRKKNMRNGQNAEAIGGIIGDVGQISASQAHHHHHGGVFGGGHHHGGGWGGDGGGGGFSGGDGGGGGGGGGGDGGGGGGGGC